MKPELIVIEGSGALLETAEDVVQQVKDGNVECLAVVMCTPDGEVWLSVSAAESSAAPWARLLAGAASLQHELLTNGL